MEAAHPETEGVPGVQATASRATVEESIEVTDEADEMALAVVKRPMPTDEGYALACAVAGGGIKGAETAAKAYAKVVVGRAFGFDAGRSLMSISIVEGKPTFEYPTLLAFVRASGRYDYDIVERSETAAEVHWFRLVDGKRGDLLGKSRWTVEDSERAGLFEKKAQFNPHVKYPRAMLLARAVAEGIRAYVPDVVFGMPVYAAGELEEELAARAAIRAEARVVEKAPTAPEPKAIAQSVAEVVGPTATIEMNGKHVAGPAPTVPAPKDEPAPVATTAEAPSTDDKPKRKRTPAKAKDEAAKTDAPPAEPVVPAIPKALLERVLKVADTQPSDSDLANDVHSWAEEALAKIGVGAELAVEAWKSVGIDLASSNAEPLGKHLQGVFEWVTAKAKEKASS